MKRSNLYVLTLLIACFFSSHAFPAVSATRHWTSFATMPPNPIVKVQSQDVPEVVRLLAQRALRAERRGDMATAEELYKTIRDLGFIVRRPSAGTSTSGGEADFGSRGGGGSGGRDSDEGDDDDGDDGDSDGGDDGDGGDGDGDGDGGDGDGDGGDGDGDGGDGDGDGGDGDGGDD